VAAVIKLTDRKTKSSIAKGESWIMTVDRTGTVHYGRLRFQMEEIASGYEEVAAGKMRSIN
jgi:hypothetical protein